MIDYNRFISKIDRFYIEFEIVESIKSLKSESTLIDNRIRIPDSIPQCRFDSGTLIALAYSVQVISCNEPFFGFEFERLKGNINHQYEIVLLIKLNLLEIKFFPCLHLL